MLRHLQERLDVAPGHGICEYAWFNNVETKPGIGYPKDWENQERWRGGWERKRNSKIVPKQGGRRTILAKIFANPHLPKSTIITSHSPLITSICTPRRNCRRPQWRGRSRSSAAGRDTEELMEAIWVAAEMRAGGVYAHSTLMLATLAEEEDKRRGQPAS